MDDVGRTGDAGAERGRSPVTSGAAAIGVVLVAVLIWWLLSGNGPQGPRGNDDRLAVADVDASGSGTGAPKTPAAPGPANPRGLRIDSYVVEAPDRLALNYTTGVPACSGRLDTPQVIEDDGGVTVTLSLVPPEDPADACIEVAVLRTVRVSLGSALDGRAVLDGSVDPRVRVEAVSTPYE